MLLIQKVERYSLISFLNFFKGLKNQVLAIFYMPFRRISYSQKNLKWTIIIKTSFNEGVYAVSDIDRIMIHITYN